MCLGAPRWCSRAGAGRACGGPVSETPDARPPAWAWRARCSRRGCALNRSQVKSLTDPDAARIQFDPVTDTTIVALNELTAQCGPARNRRVREEERHVYRVVAPSRA